MTEFKALNLFKREDFALKVVSLLRLMDYNGETGMGVELAHLTIVLRVEILFRSSH